jgi:hypothetical protein
MKMSFRINDDLCRGYSIPELNALGKRLVLEALDKQPKPLYTLVIDVMPTIDEVS